MSEIPERLQIPADGCRAARPDCGSEHGFQPLKMFHLQKQEDEQGRERVRKQNEQSER